MVYCNFMVAKIRHRINFSTLFIFEDSAEKIVLFFYRVTILLVYNILTPN